MIGELTDDFGYILFYFPFKKGEKKIILSSGKYFDGIYNLDNWNSEKNRISMPEPVTADGDFDKLSECIGNYGQSFDEEIYYCILDNAESSLYAEIICFIKKLQKLIRRDLTVSEVKKVIFKIRE